MSLIFELNKFWGGTNKKNMKIGRITPQKVTRMFHNKWSITWRPRGSWVWVRFCYNRSNSRWTDTLSYSCHHSRVPKRSLHPQAYVHHMISLLTFLRRLCQTNHVFRNVCQIVLTVCLFLFMFYVCTILTILWEI